MRLDVKALTVVAAVISAVIYAVCCGFYAAAPEATARFISYVLHLDLTGISQIITWGSFFAGLVFWTATAALAAAVLAWLYNRLAAPEGARVARRERAPE
jgi:hypothetical protein